MTIYLSRNQDGDKSDLDALIKEAERRRLEAESERYRYEQQRLMMERMRNGQSPVL